MDPNHAIPTPSPWGRLWHLNDRKVEINRLLRLMVNGTLRSLRHDVSQVQEAVLRFCYNGLARFDLPAELAGLFARLTSADVT